MDLKEIFVCPKCKKDLIIKNISGYHCLNCSMDYSTVNNITIFLDMKIYDNLNDGENAINRQTFWDRGWGKRTGSSSGDQNILLEMNKKDFLSYISKSLTERKNEKHMITEELNQEIVRNKVILNIGCGAGLEGPILSFYGGKYIGVDFSFNAVKFTKQYLDNLGYDEGIVAQADAEKLPIRSNSIDIIYSNGVLHHTPNTNLTLDEVYRVLKPGGIAFIGLYASYSTIFIIEKIVSSLRKGKKWFCYSEAAWKTEGCYNLWTKTYSKKELISMLGKYKYKRIIFRKYGSAFEGLPLFLSSIIQKSNSINNLGKNLGFLFGGMFAIILEK